LHASETLLLQDFIFSQQTTANGLYNVGLALLQNKSVRDVYNRRQNKPDDDLQDAQSLIKKAARAGCANAAWYWGDKLHGEAKDDDATGYLEDAIATTGSFHRYSTIKRRYAA
jgi:hypothetical protein